MKHICCIIFILIAQQYFLLSQKHDNIWLFGYAGGSESLENDLFGISILDFSSGVLDIYDNQEINMHFDEANTSICDSAGNLLFYTNGVNINNRLHELMQNGNNLNTPDGKDGYILDQGVLALPYPGHAGQYILFSGTKRYYPGISLHMGYLYYSILDMNANNGLGKVFNKKSLILSDTLDIGKLTAVRHGNGRDWWMLVNESNTNRFYQILINPLGVHVMGTQTIGGAHKAGLGQSVFSPDGRFFVSCTGTFSNNTWLYIYDFDRCTGLLSNQRIKFFTDAAESLGVAISANSRFLYYTLYKKIFQFDLSSVDIFPSQKTVAVYDGSQNPFGSTFFLAQLAPDNKIYINCNNGENVMHVIHDPDKEGLSCNVEQHGIQLPCYNSFSIPNFPNYRLYDMAGSPCDTLGIDGPVVDVASPEENKLQLKVWPNPFHERLAISLSAGLPNPVFRLYDMTGRLMLRRALAVGINEIETDGIEAGIYFWQVNTGHEKIKTGKLVKYER
jgi:hypothetical protein